MKIGVCAKVSPDPDARLKIASDAASLDLKGVKLKIADYDEYAVEEAIRTKEAAGGEVISFTVGEKSDSKLIRSGCLALGVDRAVLLTDKPADPLGVAKVLAAAIGNEGCDVVFTGKSSTDEQNFQVGIMVAELLGWAHVSQVTELSFEDKTFTATRNLDAGVRQVVTGALPAVITCEDGLNKVRYAKLQAIMKAKRKPLDETPAADVAEAGDTRTSVANMAPPPARPAGTIIEGDAATAAAELLRVLRDEAKVL